MYLEIYEATGKVGEVRYNPYSYSYNGHRDEIEEWLSTESRWGYATSAPEDDDSSPTTEDVTSERGKLERTARCLNNRGAWRCEIIQ